MRVTLYVRKKEKACHARFIQGVVNTIQSKEKMWIIIAGLIIGVIASLLVLLGIL